MARGQINSNIVPIERSIERKTALRIQANKWNQIWQFELFGLAQ